MKMHAGDLFGASSKSVRAILYVFQPGKDADRVTLDSCTGWFRHAGRFHESRTYEFAFDGRLSKGDVIRFLDKKIKNLFMGGVVRRRACGAARNVLTTFLAAAPPGRRMRPHKTIKSFYEELV